ncbi:hypothetical protein ALQ08_102065 [Pseudomonas syringae pv. delphinii]|uniref:2OG-Fe dioxygenase family protein n=3 Tax=Pseudomonas syringae group TaxID=136849 RepID=A0A0P9TS37_9PSED|nr:hypothetical protein ALO72_101634 [Pseudomonas syringae pv. delphinii]RMP08840.1 hypothetical protein ALQ28_101938 [Pseudomonas syringae pv. delphinii]RMP22494.1 hypothetical protein ALQ27_102036 [Pseudomonas syringae pv. delphinii]RMQ28513.1 hypothetical protein ALQ08_102065 [Pseudomonas syringae pv. delphinii]
MYLSAGPELTMRPMHRRCTKSFYTACNRLSNKRWVDKAMDLSDISKSLKQQHYCHAPDFCKLIHFAPEDADSFRQYWSNLVLDEAFKEYTNRQRRILRYRLLPSRQLEIDRNPAFKSPVTYAVNYRQGVNLLSYAEESFIAHPVLRQVVAADIAVVGPHLTDHTYSIDIHQFRVRADTQITSPTTSGIHQDGLDWVFMHFVDASNTAPVVSNIYLNENAESLVLSLTMERFLETIVVRDSVAYHQASDVSQASSASPAWRDVLVVGFRRVPDVAEQETC